MSSGNPNSGTSGSSSPSPSPSPNSGENKENIVPQIEEIQADETVPKEEEQSAADTADSASKEEEIPKQENPDEKIPEDEEPEEDQEEEDPEEEDPDKENPVEEIPKQENPVEEIPKPENPDEEMAQEEEDPEEEILKQENPEPEITQEENPKQEFPEQANPHEEIPLEGGKLFVYLSGIVPDIQMDEQQQMFGDVQAQNRQEAQIANQAQNQEITQEENPKQEFPEQANPHEEIPLEGGKLFAYLSGIVPDIQMDEQQQMFGDVQAQNRQEAQIANQAQNQEQVIEAAPLSYWSDNLEDYGFFGEDSANLEYENAKLDAMYTENLSNEPNRGSGNRGQENPTIDSIPTFDPNRGMGSGEFNNPTIAEILAAISTVEVSNQAQNQEQVIEAAPLSYYWSDNLEDYGFFGEDSATLEYENAKLDAMYAENSNRGSGNRGQENPTIDSILTFAELLAAIPTVEVSRGMGIAEPENPTIANIYREPENPSFSDMFSSIFPFDPNRGIANRGPENPTIAEMFASLPPIEPNRGNGNTDPENPTNAEMLAALPPKKRMRMLENPTIDPTFDSRPAINPNKGFTIREPQNPTNNPAPAAVPEQQDKGKGKDKNPWPTEIDIYIPQCFLFPGSISEEEDDIITMKFVSAYSRNHRPLPSAGSPEHFDTLFAFISSQLPQGESISLETLKEKFAKLVKKYLRLLRQRDMFPNFEALAPNYDRELYRLGREVWGNAYAEGYRFPPGQVGTSETTGDSS